jgi:hypothetical protein
MYSMFRFVAPETHFQRVNDQVGFAALWIIAGTSLGGGIGAFSGRPFLGAGVGAILAGAFPLWVVRAIWSSFGGGAIGG